MTKGRLEAFSDGVIAIIITIMVLEIKIPEATGWTDLASLWPKFVSYILSFILEQSPSHFPGGEERS